MKNIGIIGGTGYTGRELARILSIHPEVKITAMTSRQNTGTKVSDMQPNLKGYVDLEFTETIPDSADVDLVFTATPHGASMKQIPLLMETGIKTVDLSGDYRFKNKEVYEKWYGFEHTDPDNIPEAVYGMPEFYRKDIAKAKLVANPGCYATSAILAIAPLVQTGLISNQVFVDGKSGTSGAGMNPSQLLHHPNCGESVLPYGIGTHRHTPEIEAIVKDVTSNEANVFFVPHLIPIVRGILSTCYAELTEDTDQKVLDEVYEKFYGKEYFVNYTQTPSLRSVVASNHAEVSATVRGKNAVAMCVIDNLVKGASGQAVQCMNIMLGFEETLGIRTPGLGV